MRLYQLNEALNNNIFFFYLITPDILGHAFTNHSSPYKREIWTYGVQSGQTTNQFLVYAKFTPNNTITRDSTSSTNSNYP